MGSNFWSIKKGLWLMVWRMNPANWFKNSVQADRAYYGANPEDPGALNFAQEHPTVRGRFDSVADDVVELLTATPKFRLGDNAGRSTPIWSPNRRRRV